MENVRGRNIVITGGSRGIGKAMAQKFAAEGANLALIASNPVLLEETRKELCEKYNVFVRAYPLNISNQSDVSQTFERIYNDLGNIDILINNAGVPCHEYIKNLTFDQLKLATEVNFYGSFFTIKAVLDKMLENNSGQIINITSGAARITREYTAGYAATKAALTSLSEGLYLETKHTNVNVTTVLLGAVKTQMQQDGGILNTKYSKAIREASMEPEYVAEEIFKLVINPVRIITIPKRSEPITDLYSIHPEFIDNYFELVGKSK